MGINGFLRRITELEAELAAIKDSGEYGGYLEAMSRVGRAEAELAAEREARVKAEWMLRDFIDMYATGDEPAEWEHMDEDQILADLAARYGQFAHSEQTADSVKDGEHS
jgi:hypothetical protein